VSDLAEKFGLKESTLEKIVGCVRANKKVNQAILYGSRAKGLLIFAFSK